MNQEAEKILQFLNEKENYESIGIYGYSLGGSVATKLANKFNNINLLICDRTFSSIENIVRTRLDNNMIYFLLKFFMINDTYNHEDYFNITNKVKKILICDYNDEVVYMDSSLKRGIEFKLKKEIIFNEFKNILKKGNQSMILNNNENNREKMCCSIRSFNHYFNDVIRNKDLFTNVEYEKFKFNFQKTLEFINERDLIKNHFESTSFKCEELNGFEKKENDNLINKDKFKIFGSITILKNELLEFFKFYAKETKFLDLFDGFLLEKNISLIDKFLNVIIFN